MLPADDGVVWYSIGHDLLQAIVAVTVETFMMAIYTTLVVKATMLLVRRRSYTRNSVFLCTCCGIHAMFILVLSLWIIDIHNVVSEIQNTMLPPLSGSSLADAYAATRSASLRLAAVEDALYAYMSNIGDGFIIWRVYALWSAGRERYVFLVPLTFLVCSFAISAMLTYCTAVEGANIVLGTFQNPAFCRDMQTASYAMTLATTGVATLLIACKAWKYYRTCREIFGGRSRQTRAQRIMLLLIESGVLYMLFFLVQVVESVDSVAKSINEHPSVAFGFTVFEFNTSIFVVRAYRPGTHIERARAYSCLVDTATSDRACIPRSSSCSRTPNTPCSDQSQARALRTAGPPAEEH
ncbi:hypothetical protein BD413DRAFT_150254 [Trametes elegans]|nr:hypothetical protein BD413DRAFT_150254 [Trametes elegans]